jgi:hypothetical protein
MNDCHIYIAQLAPQLIQNKHAFTHNDKDAIIQELNDIIHQIQHVIHTTNTVASLKHIIDAQIPISDIFREFYYVIHTYLSYPICKRGDRDFANIFREYLCADSADNLVDLYHFMANIGIIEAGCTRIYLVDKSQSGTSPNIITDENIFLQNILNPAFRISKSAVMECIRNAATKDVRKLNIARALLDISHRFRITIKDFCPKIYKNWTPQAKAQHAKFEEYLSELVNMIDHVLAELRRR